MKRTSRYLAAVALACTAPVAGATYHTYIIDELYSNADGTVQYVVLREAQGVNGENLLTGHTLTATHAGVTKTFTFNSDLPIASTANKRVLIATSGFALLNLVMPDYVVPNRFLPTDGGTIDYAGVDQITYESLPTDGVNALLRNATTAPNAATNFAGQSAAAPALPVTVVEYYNPTLDHYFISALAPDIDALDSGRIAGWSRTGQTFKVFPSQASGGAGVNPVCRFYIPPQHGDSHFFSASPVECSAVLAKIPTDPDYSGYVYESPNVFYIALPDTMTGTCPANTIPVYRLWNHRADSNHRYTTDPAIKALMLSNGYVAEGYGPDAVSMCAVATAQGATQVRVSGTSPFAPGCDGVSPTGALYVGAEVEPMISINPRNPNHLVGVWQQDRWSNGGSRGVLTGVSFDAGGTWAVRSVAFSRCTGGNASNGGDYARATDPWVSFAPDGTVHQVSLSLTGGTFAAGSSNAVLVSRSSDGGMTWSDPITLIRDGSQLFNDKEAITADPTDARYVYAVWNRLTSDTAGASYLGRTTDGGLTWESARPIYDPGPVSQTINNQIVVLPDGMLINFFTRFDTPPIGTATATLAIIRSADKGVSWSAPIVVSPSLARGTRDPDTGTMIRDGAHLGSIAVGPRGELVVVWQDSRFSGGARDGVAFSRSLDAGVNWSTPARINGEPSVQAFLPTVHVRDDGTIGVTYYDLRNNTPNPATLPTDQWLTQSNDGVTWRESHGAAPFDLAIAPFAGGLFLGDYQALTSIGDAFVPFFVQTNDGNLANRTDVFVLRPNSAAAAVAATTAKSGLVDRAAVEGTQRTIEVRAQAAEPLAMTLEVRQRLHDSVMRTIKRRLVGLPSADGAETAPTVPH